MKQSLHSVEELISFLNKYSLLTIEAFEGSWIVGLSDKLASQIKNEIFLKFKLNTLKVKEVKEPLKKSINFTNYFCKLNIEKTQKQRLYIERYRIRRKQAEMELWKEKVRESIILAHPDPVINTISNTVIKYKN